MGRVYLRPGTFVSVSVVVGSVCSCAMLLDTEICLGLSGLKTQASKFHLMPACIACVYSIPAW